MTVCSPRNFDAFWQQMKQLLQKVESGDTVFNQYKDYDTEVDLPHAGDIRLENLRIYMERATMRAKILVLGEAAGPWGCRFSGVPFTGEKQLMEGTVPFRGNRSSNGRIPSGSFRNAPPFTSRSAEMFWEVMRDYCNRFVVWDVFPLHARQSGKKLSVRNPDDNEVVPFIKAIELLAGQIRPNLIVAVGRKAETAAKITLKGSNYVSKIRYVRHPSMGGKRLFEEGMTAALRTERADP